ncbi:MAG: Uma2 family endonuclease [Deltaproteobacteria bacterium]|nr:Uma2 family endonuclease [Deltaproteobacteria bacterium]
MSTATKLATYEALLTLPEGERAEVISGVLQSLPAPRPRHSKVQRVLGSVIGAPFDDDDGVGGPGGWWIFLEVDVELTRHDVVRPDVSGWHRERLADADQRPFTTVPDWVCEITSPSTVQHDRVTKRRLYAQHGVRHYWLVDPETRLLEALELRDGQWVELGVYDDTAVVRIAPFEAVELAIGRLFLPKKEVPVEP